MQQQPWNRSAAFFVFAGWNYVAGIVMPANVDRLRTVDAISLLNMENFLATLLAAVHGAV